MLRSAKQNVEQNKWKIYEYSTIRRMNFHIILYALAFFSVFLSIVAVVVLALMCFSSSTSEFHVSFFFFCYPYIFGILMVMQEATAVSFLAWDGREICI